MTGWRRALFALLAWVVHFFVAYAFMLAFPDAAFVGWFTFALGLACLAFVIWNARPAARSEDVMLASIVSAIAITFQSLVVFFN